MFARIVLFFSLVFCFESYASIGLLRKIARSNISSQIFLLKNSVFRQQIGAYRGFNYYSFKTEELEEEVNDLRSKNEKLKSTLKDQADQTARLKERTKKIEAAIEQQRKASASKPKATYSYPCFPGNSGNWE